MRGGLYYCRMYAMLCSMLIEERIQTRVQNWKEGAKVNKYICRGCSGYVNKTHYREKSADANSLSLSFKDREHANAGGKV